MTPALIIILPISAALGAFAGIWIAFKLINWWERREQLRKETKK